MEIQVAKKVAFFEEAFVTLWTVVVSILQKKIE